MLLENYKLLDKQNQLLNADRQRLHSHFLKFNQNIPKHTLKVLT